MWFGLAQFTIGCLLAMYATKDTRMGEFRYQLMATAGFVIAAISAVTMFVELGIDVAALDR